MQHIKEQMGYDLYKTLSSELTIRKCTKKLIVNETNHTMQQINNKKYYNKLTIKHAAINR